MIYSEAAHFHGAHVHHIAAYYEQRRLAARWEACRRATVRS